MLQHLARVLLALFVAALLCAPAPAMAKRGAVQADDEDTTDSTAPKPKKKRRSSSSSGGLSSTPWGKSFGIGLQLGAPSAITGKLKLEHNTAVIFGLGGGWSWGLGSGLELSLGYVVHPSLIGSYDAVNLSWYVGGAIDVSVLSHYNSSNVAVLRIYPYNTAPIGLAGHIPLGLDFQFRALPLSLYVELTPGIDLFPVVGPRLGLALGARFFF